MPPNSEFIRSLLLNAGLRVTSAGQQILALLITAQGQYLSHANVDAALREAGVRLDRVTLYRLLARLSHSGLLISHVGEDRITRFSYQADDTGSYFECQSCHQIHKADAQPDVAKALKRLAEDPRWSDFQMNHASLVIKGICARCRSD